jgi:hypothetical protein
MLEILDARLTTTGIRQAVMKLNKKWLKMVLIPFLAFRPLLGAWIANGNQEQVRRAKWE